MKLKKLFRVLVLGGATIATTACGPQDSSPPPGGQGQGNSQLGTDGGTDNGGGPHFW